MRQFLRQGSEAVCRPATANATRAESRLPMPQMRSRARDARLSSLSANPEPARAESSCRRRQNQTAAASVSLALSAPARFPPHVSPTHGCRCSARSCDTRAVPSIAGSESTHTSSSACWAERAPTQIEDRLAYQDFRLDYFFVRWSSVVAASKRWTRRCSSPQRDIRPLASV